MRARTKRGVIAGVVLLGIWLFLSAVVPAELPGPGAVFARLPRLFTPGVGGDAAGHLTMSFLRVLTATAIALVLAVLFGVGIGASQRIRAALAGWLPLWMTFPSLVVVLVAMVLFRFSNLSVISAVVVVGTPFATVTVAEGATTVDRGLLDMATVHGADRRLLLREVYLPAILPAIVGSARFLLSMVWKVVVLAETFGLSSGMGALFRFWFNQGDLEALLAALLLFVLVMIGLQAGLTRLEDSLFAWRD